jgi:2-polyprenyl-3-methyl-5-hydroxy-6-metoxy-1,4-benzoquinol methylase
MSLTTAAETFEERVPGCPVCGDTTHRSLYRDIEDRLFGAPGKWNLDGCRACGAAYLNPRPTVDAIGRVYTPSYATRKPAAEQRASHSARGLRHAIRAGFLANSHGYVKGVRLWQRILALAVYLLPSRRDQLSFGVMTLRYRPAGRLLDVGCGVGDFLAQMSNLEWETEGIDIDSAVLDICRARGLTVRAGTLESHNRPDSSFDAITAKHVIEHVHDPVRFLKECARILKPGGTLVILTPNLHSLGHRVFGDAWIGLDPPRHLVLFTRESLLKAAEEAGLRVLRLWSTARPTGFSWRVSYEVRRDGQSPYGTTRSLTQRFVEHSSDIVVRLSLLWNGRAGDELAMVATKD